MGLFDILRQFTGGGEEVVENVEMDMSAPEFTRTMNVEDDPNFNYLEGSQDRVEEKIKRYNKNPNAVIGIMANLMGENSSFDYQKKQDLNKIGDGLGPGRGLFQFDSMKKNYGKYLESLGETLPDGTIIPAPDSENAQIHWAMEQIYGDPVKSELGYPRAIKLRNALENASTPEEATTAFFEIFENPSPNDPKRRTDKLNKRLKYIDMFKKSGGGSLVERNPYYN